MPRAQLEDAPELTPEIREIETDCEGKDRWLGEHPQMQKSGWPFLLFETHPTNQV